MKARTIRSEGREGQACRSSIPRCYPPDSTGQHVEWHAVGTVSRTLHSEPGSPGSDTRSHPRADRAFPTIATKAFRASSGVSTVSGKASRAGRGPLSVTTDISKP